MGVRAAIRAAADRGDEVAFERALAIANSRWQRQGTAKVGIETRHWKARFEASKPAAAQDVMAETGPGPGAYMVSVPHVVDPRRASFDVYRHANRNGQRVLRRALGPNVVRFDEVARSSWIAQRKTGGRPIYRFIGRSNVAVIEGLTEGQIDDLRRAGCAVVPNALAVAASNAVSPNASAKPTSVETEFEPVPSPAPRNQRKAPVIAMIDTGADATSAGISSRLAAAWRWQHGRFERVEPPTSITDRDQTSYHGTRTAAAAAGDRHGPGTSADIAILAVLRDIKAGDGTLKNAAYLADVLESILVAVEFAKKMERPMIVNMSLTFDDPAMDPKAAEQILKEITVISRLQDSIDVFFVAAAGNHGKLCFPASAEHVIAVGAHDDDRRPWNSSGEGYCPGTQREKPDCHARGVDMSLPTPQGPMIDSGTSFACARMAGYISNMPLHTFTGTNRYDKLHEALMARCERISHANDQRFAFGYGAPRDL